MKIFFCLVLLAFISCSVEVTSKEYCSAGSSCGNFTYEGQKYMTVTIGTQVWMAENLNYEVSGSKCYDNKSYNCTKYGRLYDWAAAMNLPSICNSTSCAGQISNKHQGICPSGWHIPSRAEWQILSSYVQSAKDCSDCDGRFLKATSGWNENSNGEDEFGFAALPGGNGNVGGDFDHAFYGYEGSVYNIGGYGGHWWSASEGYGYANSAYNLNMNYDTEDANGFVSDKMHLFSVRCVQD